MKIAINRCYGGFSLSDEAVKYYLNLKGKECHFYYQKAYNDKTFYKTKSSLTCSWNNCFTKDFGEECTLSSDDWKNYHFYCRDIERNDPDLIKTIEHLGEKANGECAELEIREIPDDVLWEIDEYDGVESIHEQHRSW
ncbi:MAG: hypothetical protein M0R17_02795 [Candidatus Omnitrophica bacterium]|jgi:hypothetical protein|nr:hypothetical protein [Candidatus Omnitrophota bacterium]